MATGNFEIEYEFEELRIFGEGVMAWGTATLTHDMDGEFYVSEIVLKDGTRFTRRHGTGALGSEFSRRLFDLMAIDIENDEDAKDFFTAALKSDNEPVDDDYQYQAWKDRQMDDQWVEAAE
jgi:hypothetical protein